ncbi:uncharacterized protein [Clytia hemisphaerica]|uniref:uncharacterized protein n=1 Tax=Clytia hemisphaerica TaxID=252671 RepID=UPI0034D5BFA2
MAQLLTVNIENAKDKKPRLRVYGTNTSLTCHDETRRMQTLEPYATSISMPEKALRPSVANAGNVKNYKFDDGMIEEGKELVEAGEEINLTRLGLKYHLMHSETKNVPGHISQVTKEILLANGVDGDKMKLGATSGTRRRRAKRKILDTNIPVPTDESSSKIKTRLKDAVNNVLKLVFQQGLGSCAPYLPTSFDQIVFPTFQKS